MPQVSEELRTTESPLAMPSLRQAGRLLSRALRLKCPNCGAAPVLERCKSFKEWGVVRARCSACHFRFERTDDYYFSGALFTNLFISEGVFAFVFALTVVLMWPDVPWDGMTIVAVAGAVIVPALLYPFSKVMWLTVDVLVRPITPKELL